MVKNQGKCGRSVSRNPIEEKMFSQKTFTQFAENPGDRTNLMKQGAQSSAIRIPIFEVWQRSPRLLRPSCFSLAPHAFFGMSSILMLLLIEERTTVLVERTIVVLACVCSSSFLALFPGSMFSVNLLFLSCCFCPAWHGPFLCSPVFDAYF